MVSLLVHACICGLALFGLVIAVAWVSGDIALVRWFELDQLRWRCRALSDENRELRDQIRQLKRLGAIDNAAQRTTRALLQVAAEELRTVDGRAIERR